MGFKKGQPLEFTEVSQSKGVTLVRIVDGKEQRIEVKINFIGGHKNDVNDTRPDRYEDDNP